MKRLLYALLLTYSLALGDMKSDVHLTISQGGLLSSAIIQQVFGSMGFKADMHHFVSTDGMVEMDCTLYGKKAFDAKGFSAALSEHQIMIKFGQFKNKQWMIGLDASQAFWNLASISEDEGAQLEKRAFSYWFVVNKAQGISIEAPYGNKWYPEVAVFNRNMQVLASFREFKSHDRLNFKLPENAIYLKVSNANGMKMLKEGTWVGCANDAQ
ncbi:MAG: hypothetical protein PHV62_00630 [Sulfuricurvum sp.]|nr:hypothetical protein [Sulfuricurvum sp.]